MKRLAFLLAATLLLSAILCPPAVLGEELPKADELLGYIESEFRKTHIPAMSVQIVNADEILLSDSFGEGGGPDTPYILGSISKSFTAAAVMQLAEQGKIDLSKPAAEYLPEVLRNRKTTVKQLLNQTSGIHTYMTLESYSMSDTPADWEYANVNYNLLGQVVERVSGIGYAEYIKTQIFEPLGMKHSYVSLDAAKEGGLIGGHRNYFGFMVEEEAAYPEGMSSGWMTLPAAYIISTANDMGKYLQAYLNGGGAILTPESVKAMQTDTAFAQTDYEYGYGWGVDNRSGETILVHGGNVENYTTYMFLLPERGLACIALFNACDYLVANSMAVQLPYNIAYRLMGLPAQDISPSAYLSSHLLIDGILLLLLLAGLLPLIRFKSWCGKAGGRRGIGFAVWTVLLHGVLPTLILFALSLFGGIPLAVIRRFAPDVFIVQVVSAALLYAVGVGKLAYRVFRLKKQPHRVIRSA